MEKQTTLLAQFKKLVKKGAAINLTHHLLPARSRATGIVKLTKTDFYLGEEQAEVPWPKEENIRKEANNSFTVLCAISRRPMVTFEFTGEEYNPAPFSPLG